MDDGTRVNPATLSKSAFSPTSISASAAVNRAPTLSVINIGEPPVASGRTSSVLTVASLLSQAHYSDLDGTALPKGIAITGETSSSEIWQYMLPGGAWTPLPSVSPTAALLLPSTASLRLVAGVFPGTATFTFQGWDQTQSSAGHTFNIVSAGGATAFSTASTTLSLVIKQAPSWTATAGAGLTPIAPGSYSTTNPSTPAGNTVASVFGGFFHDDNAGVTVGVAIVGATGNGTWQFSTNSGVSWTNLRVVSTTSALLLSANDQVRFVPKRTTAGTATLIRRAALHGTTGVEGQTFNPGAGGGVSAFSATTLTAVAAANDAPSLTNLNVSESAITAGTTSSVLTVASLLSQASYSDPDGTTLPRGIAIISLSLDRGALPNTCWREEPGQPLPSVCHGRGAAATEHSVFALRSEQPARAQPL